MQTGAHPTPLLRQRDFAALWWGQFISMLGDRLTYLALGGLLLEHTHRGTDSDYPVLLAMLNNVMVAPVLLFAPFTGPWVDRMNLKRVLVISDLCRALVVLGIPWAYTMGQRTGPTFALVFIMFTCNVLFLPAKSALTPEIVPAEQLLGANSLLSVAGIAATVVGALFGGYVVDHFGWPFAMRLDSLTYLVSVITLVLVRYSPERHAAQRPEVTWGGYLREVGEGWALIRRRAPVALGLVTLAAVWVGGGFLQVAGNPHIQRAASVPGMERVGLLLGSLGLGAMLGTWWINSRGKHLPRPMLLGAGYILASGALVAFAVSSRFAVFAIAALLVGAFIAPAFVLCETLLQEGVDLHQRGRVFSARDFLMRLALLLSGLAAAWLTPLVGTRDTLLVCAGLIAAIGMLALVWGRSNPGLMKL
ncbi:MAG TPA: MFS transporter [Candidatus Sulfotelmatobacter sp.]|nr:MFS transporter [Candidatus Sulfotelmatobacter sp.]